MHNSEFSAVVLPRWMRARVQLAFLENCCRGRCETRQEFATDPSALLRSLVAPSKRSSPIDRTEHSAPNCRSALID
jgi:hypothetical protein